MAAQYADLNLLRFLLFHVHDIKELFQHDTFSHLDEEQAQLMIDSAVELADRDMFPYYQEMDAVGIHYEGEGKVKTHPQLNIIIRHAAEQGWIGASATFEHGGLQLPEMINNSAQHIFQAANNGVQGYLGLSAGAARLITTFGTPEQVKTFVTPIFEGKWQGTMALTEPQAGSSLTDLTTSARPSEEGYYHINGQKIFISAGQHEGCENFVHLTLARIEGAPAGVKGISLFIIPKHRPIDNGGLEYNDVFCAGEYQKMGQKCYSTTHLVFGEHDNCRGYLVGEPNNGLSYMFQMMNEARIGVGQTAASAAMAAYQASLQYAKERSQGRLPSEKDPNKEPVPIIRHADVQRMLLTQKAISEGAISLAMECNKRYDLSHVLEGQAHKDNQLILELLTPIIKTYGAEQGSRSASLAIQVLGGYGYTLDFPVQQHYRDLKIMAIYEGTTGIQSLDLLGRKVTIENGKALHLATHEILETIEQATPESLCAAEAELLSDHLDRWVKVTKSLSRHAAAGNIERYLADATVYMEMSGLIIIGWQWLKMGLQAEALQRASDTGFTSSFLEAKIHTMRFFFRYELPQATSHATTLMDDQWLTQIENMDMF